MKVRIGEGFDMATHRNSDTNVCQLSGATRNVRADLQYDYASRPLKNSFALPGASAGQIVGVTPRRWPETKPRRWSRPGAMAAIDITTCDGHTCHALDVTSATTMEGPEIDAKVASCIDVPGGRGL
jgi:hypothetical protein